MSFEVEFNNKKYFLATDYRESSDALILLIHGLGCTKDSYKEMFNDKKFNNSSLLAPDLLGYGNSSKPEEFSYLMEDQAEVLSKLLKSVSYKEIHIVAHSMGNAIGLLLTRKLPNIKSYTNIEGNLIAEDAGLLSRKTASVSFEEFDKSFFNELRDIIGGLDEVGAKIWVEQTKKASPLAFYKSAISLRDWSDNGELIKTFEALTCKKAYLYGSENATMPIVGRLDENLKVEIPNSGHFIMDDNPEAFLSTLDKIINN